MSEAFITGSRAYGRPKKSSDVDLVIRCDEETAKLLIKKSELGKEPVRFGKLNLIICTTDEQFAVWKLGTEHMKGINQESGKTFDKEKAKVILDGLRKMVGLNDRAREWS